LEYDYVLPKELLLYWQMTFQCDKCGECCRTCAPIDLTREDRLRIARHFKMDLKTFERKYARKTSKGFGTYVIKKDFPCQFLKGNECMVYEVRPGICRDYPFLGATFLKSAVKRGLCCKKGLNIYYSWRNMSARQVIYNSLVFSDGDEVTP